MQSRTTLGLIAILSATALGGGVWAMNVESRPFLVLGTTPVQRAASLDPQSVSVGMSYGAAKAVLGDCVVALQVSKSLEVLYLGDDGRQRLKEACLEAARTATAHMPLSSYAWFAKAQASLAAGLTEDFNSDLVTSQLMGSTEQWIAERRVSLAEDNFAMLDETALAAHERDLRLLVMSSVGLRSLARRYVSKADFRQRIADIVETMPENSQQRFINNLQLALQSR